MAAPPNDPVLEHDPVLERRARIGAMARTGKRIGYLLFAYAVVVFVIGYEIGFRAWLVDSIIAAMAVGSFLLVPAIVFDYGVKAANREDREQAAGGPQRGSSPSPH